MLHSLYIKNFALIDDVEVNFGGGLNIVTGETGAGKSMLIDALQVALGSRASADFIRTGRDKATVQATFDLAKLPWLSQRLSELGLDLEDDDLLVLAREINRNGKNYCRVNGRLVSLNVYREVGGGLVDMLGQHEQQTLLNQDRHRALLDKLGGPQLINQAKRVKEIYRQWRDASTELKELENNARELARRLDMLTFQVAEIDKAALVEGEEEELLNERKLLVNAEKIARLAGESYDYLYGGETGGTSAVDAVGKAAAALKELAEIDGNLHSLVEAVESALYQLEDAAREISSYRDDVEYNPDRLDEIEHRLSLIKQLKYKYGASIQEILEFRHQAAAEIGTLANSSEKTELLKTQIKTLEQAWQQEAQNLSHLRKKAARELEQAAAKELKYLEMGSVAFRVGMTETGQLSPNGAEEIEFLIAPNPGEPLRPLQKIASGGELSRIMLVLKVLLAGVDEVPTLIFDEVDTGVGGKALQAIGEKLAKIGQNRQVICVTHAPQVACFADNHYLISKTVVDGHAQTSVTCLDESARVEELARMLAGREITDVVKDHAEQMLKMSAKLKI
ncbi:DNA repair protein RecN [Desulfotomaculum nigrificans CO-1-SRB]|uniref:DNA repair protein RecN n=1 Tax=Desulfotomaculum nigrificans (strain DSM 14880 / VKM B-2319 / CO-1-SRB) TaxID=868595 RepID=F6B9N6_DESCC|nr:DNA repair protein RecN [Desulfotomaculum nigrificans]AEF94932.1 DNA repair protein RecN [Desulfotomaculum nigrificans CO-1-SRB]